MVMEVLHEETGEGSLQCMNHLYRNSAQGGICAFCLQEKLGKLVSSSFQGAVFPSSAALHSPHLVYSSANTGYNRRSRLPFMLNKRRKKKKDEAIITSSDPKTFLLERSKSNSTLSNGVQFLNDESYPEDRKSRSWSFRFMSKQQQPTSKKSGKKCKEVNFPSRNRGDLLVVDDNGSPDEVSFDRKVSRSRSVGCSSRSFSGDFFDRISTGFGDCTLRRVESQRERKGKVNGPDYKERVKCGGIFSGFTIPSSSSSSSSSSNEDNNLNGKSISASSNSSVRNPSHVRSKSWGWAFASPMRASGGKPSAGKRVAVSSKNATTTNLAEIPSILAVSG